MEMIDHEQVLKRYDGDVNLIRVVCEAFVSEQPVLMADLNAAVKSQCRDDIRKAAHAIKGSANNVGATIFKVTAHTLEQGANNIEWTQVEQLCKKLGELSVSVVQQVKDHYLA